MHKSITERQYLNRKRVKLIEEEDTESKVTTQICSDETKKSVRCTKIQLRK